MRRLYFLFCLFLTSEYFAQSNVTDSLKLLLSKASSDTVRMKLQMNLGDAMVFTEPDSAMSYFAAASETGERILRQKLEPGIQKNFEYRYANAITSQGYMLNMRGMRVPALELFHKGLKIFEKQAAKSEYAVTLINIGLIYGDQNDHQFALKYFHDALKILEKIKDQENTSNAYNNIAAIHLRLQDVSRALEFFKKSLYLRQTLNDVSGIAQSYNNIGWIYYEKAIDADTALMYFTKSLELFQSQNVKSGIALALNNIAKVYIQKKRYSKAEEYSLRSLELSKEVNYPERIRNAASNLKIIYKETGNYRKALEMHELYITMRDSLTRQQDRKASLQKQFQYEYEKKTAADSLIAAEEKKLANAKLEESNAKLKQERTQRFALYGGLGMMLVFAGFIFNRYKVTSKQKKIIELKEQETLRQKHIVEDKNKEITDSITYAKRLQEAILPPQQYVNTYFPENFILYKPKDLVAGDFYWMEALDGKAFIAAADSTGHGVPGAMVSVVCSNALHRTLNEFKIAEPGRILDKTRELVLETFSKSETDVKDGMDISLLCFDTTYRKIYWSGANNPLWYVQNNELKEIKADKQPIGKTDMAKPFTTHEIDYHPGTVIYLFTDGYADQFGGPKGKKFKYKPMQNLLLANSLKDMAHQKVVLDTEFEKWKSSLDQIDDVCVIGIKL